MNNYIGIDTSKNSTGLCIESGNKISLFNYTNLKPSYKWIKMTSDLINFRFYNYEEVEDYSDNEIQRLKIYAEISNQIVKDILENIDLNEKTIICQEGYNYGSSNLGYIIDCVAIGTMVRLKVLENIPNCEIKIIAPKQVKTLTCERVYGKSSPKIGKKGQPLKEIVVARNDVGLAGGSFEKVDMLKAMIDGNIKSPILQFCIDYRNEITSGKDVKKPFQDAVDSIFLKEIIK